MISLDGSKGEGGGQVLRSALTLSILTGKPFRIKKIRARRRNPGLMRQHLMSVIAAKTISNAHVQGDYQGSTNLQFEPNKIEPGDFQFDIKTAGAVTLVLQTIYLPLALLTRKTSVIRITGGTHVPYSPSVHFISLHWLYFLKQIGIDLKIDLVRAGFYPKGGGEIAVAINPNSILKPLVVLQRGVFQKIQGFSLYANLSPSVAERQKNRLLSRLRDHQLPGFVKIEKLEALSPNAVSVLLARYQNTQIACESLGALGKPVEKVADEAFFALVKSISSLATMDVHVADQLLLPLCCIAADSEFVVPEISGHIATLRDIIQIFLPAKIEFYPREKGVQIKIHGVSLT